MAQALSVQKKSMWFRHVGKVVTVAASSGAALVSIFTALYSYGVIGSSESHQSIGNLGAAWVGLRPAIDTATSIDDTVHFAATVTDKNGSILVGARPIWTTGDSSIATVLPDGSVIARGPGRTMVSVVVGKLVTHSTIIVQQRVTSVEVARGASNDSVIVLPEGATMQLRARAMDARGHLINGASASWHVDDNVIVGLDSAGVLTAKNAGRTIVAARVDGVSGRTGVSVVTPAAAVAVVAGGNQRALAGKTLPQSVVVRATNRRGEAAPGKRVSFRLADGQGAAEPVSAITDADGRARTSWTLAAYPGRQTLLATVENVDSALAIIAEADPIAANTKVVPIVEKVTGKAGETLSDSIAVRLTDAAGRTLADVPVRWTALDGGTVVSDDPRTDSLGMAKARWTLGKKTGMQRLRAQVGSGAAAIEPVTITASALAGAASAVTVVSGDGQHAAAGSNLPKSLVFKVVDENGSGVAGATLTLTPSGGVLPDSALVTDSTGVARTGWSMGRSAGDYSLGVHVEGVKKLLKVVAHATPAAAANLAFDDAPGDKKGRDAARRKKLFALVTDVYGNPVPDARVNFSVKSGTVAPARAVSDAKGRAAVTWTLGSKPGEQTLTGVVRGSDVKGEYVTVIGASREPLTKTASLRSTR